MGGTTDDMPLSGRPRGPATAGFGSLWSALTIALAVALALSLPLALWAGPDKTAGSGPEDAAPPLEIVNCDLLDSRDGFAIPPDTQYLPGERVHLICQVRGYRVGPEERVHVSYELRALDPRGRSFYPLDRGQYDTELAPQDENWLPIIRYSPLIPDHASGGSFVMRVSVTDHLAGASVGTQVPFQVDAPQFDPMEGLRIREFYFRDLASGLHSWEPSTDDELDPPEAVLHRPGDEVPASFLITGFEVREDNSFDVESQAWLVDADGQELLDFGATRESGRPNYPRLWLPGSIRIELDPEIAQGDYRVKLRVYDRIAREEKMEEYPLRVRP